MAKVVGISLGTTNSCIAVMQEGQPGIVTNAEGFPITPAFVAYTKNRDRLVGQCAKSQALLNSENTFYAVKRFLGRKYDEVTQEAAQVSYQVLSDSDGNIKLNCPSIGKFTPEEIFAQILRKLTNDATRYLGEEIAQVVLTVPPYFTNAQRQATKDAGKIAGLEVLRIINEPIAAGLAYGLEKRDNEIVLVFDLGGDSLDITILEVGDGVFEVRSNSRDSHLGGNDLDEKIADWLADEFQRNEGINLRSNKQALQRLIAAAETAKIELSSVNQTEISLPFIIANEAGPKHLDAIMTRTQFEQMCAGLLDRCRITIEQALQDAQLTLADINEVVFVGGSTQIPCVRELVQQVTGKEPLQSINPQEVVAIGAAIQASVLGDDRFYPPCILYDTTSLSLGIETPAGIMTRIVERSTIIPIRKSAIFSTATDWQTSVEINILQGERFLAKDNKSLATLRLDGILFAPKGVPKIEVTFDIDVNHILTVSVRDIATGKEVSIVLPQALVLTRLELEGIWHDVYTHAAEDHKLREPIEARNKVASVVDETQRQLTQLQEKMSAADKNWIEELVQHLQEVKQRLNCDRTSLASNQSQPTLIPVLSPVYALAAAITTSGSDDAIDADLDFEILDN